MLHLINIGCLLIAVTLSVADDESSFSFGPDSETSLLTDPRDAQLPDTDDSQELASVVPTVMSSHGGDGSSDLRPANIALSSFVTLPSRVAMASDDDVVPTIPSFNESSETSSGSMNIHLVNEHAGKDVDSQNGFSQTEVVIVAIFVSLLSLTLVVLSVLATFLIRRRTRRKAYLRVKHASQTELAVHYVQNTPASVAARDAAMEELFQSLASMNPDSLNDHQMTYSSDDHCLTPTESVTSELMGGTSRSYSRSMPSLKNLNAHEEALNCTFAANNIPEVAGNKTKARSRSFTERAILRVDATTTPHSKSATRSHSEKAKNRLAVVALLASSGKRFEKKPNDRSANRRSAPSFSRLAKLNLLRGPHNNTKRKAPISADEQVVLPRVASHSDATQVADAAAAAAASDLGQSKRFSTSLSDFEMPNVSPILQDMGPMLSALRINSSDTREPTTTAGDEANTTDGNIRNSCPAGSDLRIANGPIVEDVGDEYHVTSEMTSRDTDDVRDKYPYTRGKNSPKPQQRTIEAAGNDRLSTNHIETSYKRRSVNNVDKEKPTIA